MTHDKVPLDFLTFQIQKCLMNEIHFGGWGRQKLKEDGVKHLVQYSGERDQKWLLKRNKKFFQKLLEMKF